MCNSLLASQTFRLMKSCDSKSQKHLYYWMHGFFENVWNGPGHCVINTGYESEHFNRIAGLLSNVQILEDFNISAWAGYTNKLIYLCFAKSFNFTKIERDSSYEMSSVWQRLKFLGFSRNVQEVCFLMVHNKLPVNERLFRIRLSRDPYCPSCAAASIQDIEHYFMVCEVSKFYWEWTRNLCHKLLGRLAALDDTSLLHFNWPHSRNDGAISWLLGHYIFIVWDMLQNQKLSRVNDGAFFGYMRYKYKEAVGMGLIGTITGLE